LISLKGDSVVWFEHDELQLYVVGDKGCPDSLGFLLQVNIELDIVLKLIVLRVRWALAEV
jgi:hypothetical protein